MVYMCMFWCDGSMCRCLGFGFVFGCLFTCVSVRLIYYLNTVILYGVWVE